MGRVALESTSAAFQTAASPSQLPARVRLAAHADKRMTMAYEKGPAVSRRRALANRFRWSSPDVTTASDSENTANEARSPVDRRAGRLFVVRDWLGSYL